MKIKPKIIYTGGKRGWVGDNPFIFLDTKKLDHVAGNQIYYQ